MNGNQERIHTNPERGVSNPKKTVESSLENNEANQNNQEANFEQLDKKIDSPEAFVELSSRDIEARAEKARDEALENAKSIQSAEKEKKVEKRLSSSRRGSISKKQLDKSYTQTMHQIQGELPVNSRIFSKIIHNKFIEKTSDTLGNTIARPNAVLAGAFCAFVLTLLTYTVAKTIGYTLSGFETIAAFFIGWIIGITYDYLRVLFTGKT